MVQEPCPRGLLGNMKRRNGKRRQKEAGIGKSGRKTNMARCAREKCKVRTSVNNEKGEDQQ